jgi:hypothetical protein
MDPVVPPSAEASPEPPEAPAQPPPLPAPLVLPYHAASDGKLTAADVIGALAAIVFAIACVGGAGLLFWGLIVAAHFAPALRVAFALLAVLLLVDAALAFFAARRYLTGRHRGPSSSARDAP